MNEWGEWGEWGELGEWGEWGDWGDWGDGVIGVNGVTQLVEDYFVQKALYSNEFLGSWTYGLINKNNNYTNLLLTGYECKPVKT